MSNTLATLDIVIGIIVLVSALIGLYRGLVKEVLALVSWIAAFVLAIYFSSSFAAYVPAQWGAQPIRLVIAFAVIFVATLIAAGLLQWLLSRVISGTGLSGMDRFLGFLFGSARGLLVCVVVLIGLREIAADTAWWKASQLQGELLAFEDEIRELVGRARDAAGEVSLPDGLLPQQLPEGLSLPDTN
ncbi:MAG: CvpA family protein [Pseudomonadota bacterium]